jgi:ribosomal protein S18 acetylase RimI-like enzyme
VSDVQAIEDATRAALVAEEREIEGWWLRCNPELPHRRPNSATTPIEGVADPDVIDEIIHWYVTRRRPPVIRVLSVSDPAIDRELEERGWTLESPTLVMTAALGDRAEPGDARALAPSGDVPPAFVLLRSRLGLDATAARLVHGRSGVAPLYAVAPAEGPAVATGRALLVAGRAGIHDVVTVPEARRRGWASQVVLRLLTSAAERGAGMAFLQVEAVNVAARGLYSSLGFATAYTYHYRRLPDRNPEAV